uniref:Uncharacterized protein n=1 Tax=Ixodes ricinus TaxID=34613 RepID=A0A6B0TXB8_IXORI
MPLLRARMAMCNAVSPLLSVAETLAFLSINIWTISMLRFRVAFISGVSPSFVASSRFGLAFRMVRTISL